MGACAGSGVSFDSLGHESLWWTQMEAEKAHDAIWQDDVLDRRADAEFLRTFLLGRISEREQRGRSKSYVLNVDAKWGFGKSFFLTKFAQSLRHDGFMVAEVNAWKDDHADDPQLSVMAAIDAAVKPFLAQKKRLASTWRLVKRSGATVAVAVVKGAAKQLSRKLIGDGFDNALQAIEVAKDSATVEAAEKELDQEVGSLYDKEASLMLQSFETSKRTIEKFRSELALFLKTLEESGGRLPLFVLVDELDRCRPTYAISLLERVKHLFDIDNVVFVIATDSSQLKHAINAVYGRQFDSARYLSRFFDRTYSFEDPSAEAFTEVILDSAPLNKEKISLPDGVELLTYLSGAFAKFRLSLRDIEQCLDILRSVVTIWSHRTKIEMAVLMPLIIGYQQKITPSLSADFHKALLDLVKRDGNDDAKWIVKFPRYIAGQGHQEQLVPGLNLFERFVQRASRSLAQLNDSSVGVDKYVERIFANEYAAVHGNSHRGREPFSILAQYPTFVLTAGRLAPQSS